jgi:hypothetical protein
MRNILRVNRFASIKGMLKALGFQSVKQRLAFNNLKLMFKIENNLAPNYLTKITEEK